ncbi:beta-ketoacyl-ACP synthase III [Streptomyces sp. PSAA01]|uniref:beta-ketoacyl-ACP synthase III n=1 Tax=Streptomyces sp. PSAA01 TaxID=2912762 RepID=UPI001F1C1B50|nr:beta-ketoacyl-ACP synthase III [Streptomyces sp. PSAA01]MCG0283812.1 ketoacyl-ACP synthase III [Streptomyces sp. PSAA01]
MVTNARAASPRFARALGVGSHRPGRIVSNEEICRLIDSDSAWIEARSGIVRRRFADAGETIPVMAARAAEKALSSAGLTPSDVSCVILASMSYLHQAPPAAAACAAELGAKDAAAFDIGAACAGFSHGLAVASGLVASRQCENVLVVGAERMSDIVDPRDRSTAFIFGDGAGALVVGPADEPGIARTVWGVDTEHLRAISQPASFADLKLDPQSAWPHLRMEGPEVFRWAIGRVAEVCERALNAAGVTVEDLDAFIPHQANMRIIDAAAKAMRLPPSVEVARTIRDDGNVSAASIPLALDTLLSSGRLAHGSLVLTAGFGSGLSYSAQVLTAP